MNIKEAIVSALNLLGGVHPTNMKLVSTTIASHTTALHRLLNIEAAAARGDARQLSFTSSYPCPPPPADMPNAAILALTATINEMFEAGAENLFMLPSASRVPRMKQCLENIRKDVNIACAEINAAHGLMRSLPTPETPNSAPRSSEGVDGPPLTGTQAFHTPPRHETANTFAALPSTCPEDDPPAESELPSYIDTLPLDVLAVIVEHIDSLVDMTTFCTVYRKVEAAMSRVHTLALAGPDEIGQPPASLTALRTLRLAAPLSRNGPTFPIQPLQCVTLDQRGPSWTADNTLYTIHALGLPTVRTVRLEHANAGAPEFLTSFARPATHLGIQFDGDDTDVLLATASRLVRSFTCVDQTGLGFILQTARTDNLVHLAISNWLPRGWTGMLFAETPASLVSLEIMFDKKPASHGAHGELQSLLHYRGGRWVWCKDLRALTLSSLPTLFEVDERDVQAFVASALGRVVEVELRGVRYLA